MKKIINLILISSLLILNVQFVYAEDLSIEEELEIVEVDAQTGEKTYKTIPINTTPIEGWGPQKPNSVSPFTVIGDDERLRVESGDELYMPFSAIGALDITMDGRGFE